MSSLPSTPSESSFLSYVSRMPRPATTLLGAACLTLIGCSGGSVLSTGPVAAPLVLHGVVHGGQQPIAGATINLYAAGTSGYGTGATSLLKSPVTTDGSGSFNITGDYVCPSASSQLYMVSTGGNPGLPGGGTNSAITLMAALGPCSLFGGQLTLDPNSFIVLNEVTTVASAYALSGFMDPVTTQIGASSTNAAGLANAFKTVNNLVNISSGQPLTTTAGGNGTVPTVLINGLADILATCVNSTGTGAQCSTLFSDATPTGGTAPTNTLQAILSIATHPTSQVSALSALGSPTAPFQPSSLTGATAFLMQINYNLFSPVQATAIGIDLSGNIWNAYTNVNPNQMTIFKYSNTGVLQTSPTGYTGPALNKIFIAFDPAGIPWIVGQATSGGVLVKLTNNGTVATNFTTPNMTFPTGIAIDGAGSVWVPNLNTSNGTASVFKFGNDGTLLSPTTGYTASSLSSGIGGAAIDNAGDAWVAGGSLLTEFDKSGNVLSGAGYTGGGGQLAIDVFGNIWPGKISPAGVPIPTSQFCGLGEASPPVCMGANSNALALDGAGNAWAAVANFDGRQRNFGIAELNSSGAEVFGPAGYIDEYDPGFLAVDSSGNLWGTPVFATSFFQSSTMIEIVGASTPIVVPSVGAQNGNVGGRP